MRESLTANGLDLNPASGWCWVEDLNPLLSAPGRRGSNVVVPGRHGTIRTPNKHYTDADLVIPMWVLGVDRDTGRAPSDTYGQLHANIDALLKAFSTPTVTLLRDRGDGYIRQAIAEPMLEPVVLERHKSAPAAARVSVALNLFGAFWEDQSPVTQVIEGPSGSRHELTEFAAATAPMHELTLTFLGAQNNPQLELGDTSVSFGATLTPGQQLVLNTANWTVSPGTGASWAPDLRQVEFSPGPVWFSIDPSQTPLTVRYTHTGGGEATCAISGRRRYLSA